ncbi:endonuclease V [Hesseltinella vesiculosa]|uniref:Endonuclease V n=1 Tax=Hesseltinella vesiculosa TaxID=101127 RepID=A0A1X2GS89_9FUNG|nr:endonuclease V [Hesseltinella vesiculosa]
MTTSQLTEYTSSPSRDQRAIWEKLQETLRHDIILQDKLDFNPESLDDLVYIGGVDLSFPENDQEHAVACLVVMKYPSMEVVYTDFLTTRLYLPYIAGFLAFREVAPLQKLLEKLQLQQPDIYPQVLLVDGNGRLHPRCCGIACHLGVQVDVPTIGIGKNFLVIDDGDALQMGRVKKEARESLAKAGDWMPLQGASGTIYGAALRTTQDAPNPIFVSQGHRITLPSAIRIVMATSRFRIPDPIRHADQKSRAYIRTHR